MQDAMPKNITIELSAGTMTIVRRWFSYIFVFFLFFSLFWNFSVLGYYTGMVNSICSNGEGFVAGEAEIMALAFPLLHLAIGLAFLYYTICGFVNRSYISISYEALEVNHRPLAWFGNKRIATHDIRQLYCEKIRGSRGGVSYNVNVITVNFDKIKLLTGLLQYEQASYIEKKIEERLGITDEPVDGECRTPH